MSNDAIAVILNPVPKRNNASSISASKLIRVLPSRFAPVLIAAMGYRTDMFSVDKELVVGRALNRSKFDRIVSAQLEPCRVMSGGRPSLAIFWIADAMIIPFLYCKFKRIPAVNYVLYDWEYVSSQKGLGASIRNRIRRYMALHADAVFVESFHVLDSWDEVKEKAKVYVAPLYVETDLFYKVIPMSSRGKEIGMVARLAPEKNVMPAIRGFEAFNAKHGGEWRLTLVGDGPLRSDVEEYVSEKGLSVSLVGWRGREEVAELMNGFRCLLMPTSTEGMPNTLLEAMACGTPALATPICGIKDLVEDGKTGWVLEGISAEEICDGLERLNSFGMPALEEMSEAARKVVNERYSFEACCEVMSDSLRAVL